MCGTSEGTKRMPIGRNLLRGTRDVNRKKSQGNEED